jgi:hypothetical protein
MAGLDPAIHAVLAGKHHQDVDARHMAGHDEERQKALRRGQTPRCALLHVPIDEV